MMEFVFKMMKIEAEDYVGDESSTYSGEYVT